MGVYGGMAALDGTNWCQLITLLFIPVAIWLAHGWRRATDAHLAAVEAHLADLRRLSRLQAIQASIPHAVEGQDE